MFDFPHSPQISERLLNSEQAAALISVHPKTLQRYARRGIVAGMRVGKLWRFRASDLYAPRSEDHEEDLDGEVEAQYAEINHSCPQPDRR
jgi:excisionase family DNA binding protein